MNRCLRILFSLVVAACLCAAAAYADVDAGTERILSFDSHIDILPDGDLVVMETIQVAAAGAKIQRGIYRDFPTRYRTRLGGRMKVRFEVLDVRRDNRPEAWHTAPQIDGVRVYIGDKNVLLEPGRYTYTLVYRVNRQVGFFDGYDELYWNVTGNDWDFVIEAATVTVQLPPGARVLQHAGYTGPLGADGKDYTVFAAEGDLGLRTTRALAPREGFTVAVAWPKGFVAVPRMVDRIGDLLADYRGAALALAGLLVLLIYYLATWWKVGRDPAAGTIIARFDPPRGISAAAARFVMEMGFDQKALAVALVSMAVKGFLRIDEDEDGVYTLEKTGAASDTLSRGEAKVVGHLFPGQNPSIVLKNTSHKQVGAALKALRTSLSAEYEKLYFLRNTRYWIPGIVISVVVAVGIVLAGDMVPVAGFMLLWLSLWSLGVYALGASVIAAWRSRKTAGAMGITLFAFPFFLGELFGIGVLAFAVSLPSLIVLLALIAANTVFYHLFKAPTLAGRKLMDEIEGLKRYLEVAEKHRLDLLNPPDRTPEHFEALLPYAMALDVENQWNEQFADVLAAAATDPASGRRVTPGWYSGRTPFNGLASSLGGAFAGAVSASSTAPGSRSGSGGGGSSGGGGGGGGGGGW